MGNRDADYEFTFGKDDIFAKRRKNGGNSEYEASTNSLNAVLECKSIEKSYGAVRALDGVSLEIPKGKVIGLFGPSGSGKTTILKMIAGLLNADSGDLRVLGMSVGVETKSVVSYLPDRNSLPNHFTVKEAIDFYEDFFADFDRARAEIILSELNIEKSVKIKNLTKGNREKVQLVLVMSRRAGLYILDEPISSVDPAARDYIIRQVINKFPNDASVIICTHLISDVEKIIDAFVFLDRGKVRLFSTPSEILMEYGKTVDEYFREVFKC